MHEAQSEKSSNFNWVTQGEKFKCHVAWFKYVLEVSQDAIYALGSGLITRGLCRSDLQEDHLPESYIPIILGKTW